MKRQDSNLAYMLQYENIAWYENGVVKILDRRVYPFKIEFVYCSSHYEVAQAITDMVTQSAGPYTAASMGMVLAAYECRHLNKREQLVYLEKASYILSHARPTTVNRMTAVVNGCLIVAKQAITEDKNVITDIFNHTIAALNNRYKEIESVATHLIKLFPKEANVLTQCFGETIVGMMLRVAKEKHKKVNFFCPETRPFFQGARLTATVAIEQGIEVTVLTDNMIAYAMQHKKIDLFTSAADSITLDGFVVNKIGTFQIAILAQYFGVPYYVTGIPDVDIKSINEIEIEYRNPNDVMIINGQKITADGVKSIYPSFDITPPKLINGIVTNYGIYSPYDLKSYARNNNDFWK